MLEERYSIAELFKAYALQKATDEWHGEWGAALLYRPVAILAAAVLLRLPVSATGVTAVSLALALSLPFFALTGPSAYLAIGLVALLVAILDCVDGTIARATGTMSRFGHYLDFVTDVIFRSSFYAAVGLIADLRNALPHWLGGRALLLAVAAALFAVAARLCRVYVRSLTGTEVHAPGPAVRRGAADNIFSAISGIDALLPVIVLAAGAGNALGWVVLWLLAYSALDFLYSQVAILRRL